MARSSSLCVIFAASFCVMALGQSPVRADDALTGDAAEGRKVFQICRNCHTVRPNKRDTFGPNLYQVIGREAGQVTGYEYSEGMSQAGWIWTPELINQFLTDPEAMVPGTKMILDPISDPNDRANVIAYLAKAGDR